MQTRRIVNNARFHAAIDHARRGHPVLPVYWADGVRCGCGKSDCRSPAKHPISHLAPRGVRHATTSLVVIQAWWTAAPRANPAIATGVESGLTVLDVDGDRGGYVTLRKLEAEFGTMPYTRRVQTASGEHVYFRYTGTHLGNRSDDLGPGLDVRCCGGYVVAAGAIHWSGRQYHWKSGHGLGQAPLAQMPQWLVARLAPAFRPAIDSTPRTSSKGYASAALASEEQQLLQTPVGQRNTRLNLAAFRLARFISTGTLKQADVESVLHDAARRLGLSEHEARATIASGLRAGLSQAHPLSPALS